MAFYSTIPLVLLLAACSPFYVIRAAYEEGKILSARQEIERLVESPQTDPELREKLAIVLDARQFGISTGLNVNDSFTTYSDIGRPVLAWVLAAAKRDRFEHYSWWFPIVGRIPYKGFFSLGSAECEAHKLIKQGYEVWLQPTDAFSTLGWFNDPLLSTTLSRSVPVLVATVLHEATHSTVWLKDNVEFNESLASFVGTQGAVDFFEQQVKASCPDGARCPKALQWLKEAQDLRGRELQFALLVNDLYFELEKLYSSTLSSETKIADREKILRKVFREANAAQPDSGILSQVNNAEIMVLKLYLGKLAYFTDIYTGVGSDWHKFMSTIRQLAQP